MFTQDTTTCFSFLVRTLLGAFTDSSIDVSDPISDRFYKEVWMTISGRNATIYEKVLQHSPLSPCVDGWAGMGLFVGGFGRGVITMV